jgi:hypothetical protein
MVLVAVFGGSIGDHLFSQPGVTLYVWLWMAVVVAAIRLERRPPGACVESVGGAADGG